MYEKKYITKIVELVSGRFVINGATPSSFYAWYWQSIVFYRLYSYFVQKDMIYQKGHMLTKCSQQHYQPPNSDREDKSHRLIYNSLDK